MKITCTTKEKENLIRVMCNSDFCLFDGITICFECVPEYCNICYENHIVWDVKGGDAMQSEVDRFNDTHTVPQLPSPEEGRGK